MNKFALLTLILLSTQQAYGSGHEQSNAAQVQQKYKPKLSMVFEVGESAFGSASSTPNAFDLRETNFGFAAHSRASNHPETPDVKEKVEKMPLIKTALIALKTSAESVTTKRAKSSALKPILIKSSSPAQATYTTTWKPDKTLVARFDDRLKKLHKSFTFKDAFAHSKEDVCLLYVEIKKACEQFGSPQCKQKGVGKPAQFPQPAKELAQMAHQHALEFKKSRLKTAPSHRIKENTRSFETLIILIEKITKAA